MKLKAFLAIAMALLFTVILGAQTAKSVKPPDAWMQQYSVYLVKTRQLSAANEKAAPEIAAVKKKHGIDVLEQEVTKMASALNAEMDKAGYAFDVATLQWVPKPAPSN